MPTFAFPDARDPAVLPRVAGLDYAAIATTSWLHAQLCQLELVDIDRRLVAADAWFEAHASDDPAYGRALSLVSQLRSRRSVAVRACWIACCEVYAAIQHLDRRTWWREDGAGLAPEHPVGVWEQFRGPEIPPGHWPPEISDHHIEGRLAFVPTWQTAELRELVERSTSS